MTSIQLIEANSRFIENIKNEISCIPVEYSTLFKLSGTKIQPIFKVRLGFTSIFSSHSVIKKVHHIWPVNLESSINNDSKMRKIKIFDQHPSEKLIDLFIYVLND